MIVWIAQIPTGYFASWSLGLCMIAAAMYVVASCLLIRDLRAQKKARLLKVQPKEREKDIPMETYYRRSPSPRYERKALPPPDTPLYTPRSIRVDVISPAFTQASSPRRYGTPKYSQRYDNRAR